MWPNWQASSKTDPKVASRFSNSLNCNASAVRSPLSVAFGVPASLWEVATSELQLASRGFLSDVARELGRCAIGSRGPATWQWCGLSRRFYLEIKALLILHFHSSGQAQKVLIHTKKFILLASGSFGLPTTPRPLPTNMYCLVHIKDQENPFFLAHYVFSTMLLVSYSPPPHVPFMLTFLLTDPRQSVSWPNPNGPLNCWAEKYSCFLYKARWPAPLKCCT